MDRYFYFDDIFEDYTKYSLKISKSLYLKSGLYPIIDQGKEEIAGYSNKNINIFDKIPVIIFGDHTRIFKYVDYPFFLGADGVKILKNTSNLFLDKYLYYSLKNFKIPDTGYNRHFKWLKDFKIKYISLAKQERITSLIEKIEFFILKKEKQLEYLKELKKSLFTRMFGDIKTNNKNWQLYEIREISNILTRGKTPKYTLSSNIFVINQACIYWDKIKYENIKFHIEEENLLFLKNKDILINSTGTGTLGRMNIIGNIINEKFTVDSHVMLLRLKKEKASPIYFINIFMGVEYQKELILKCVNGSTNQIELSKEKFSKFKIPIPPIELQNKFAERIEKIEKLSFEIEKSIKEAENLYNSLMSKYFD